MYNNILVTNNDYFLNYFWTLRCYNNSLRYMKHMIYIKYLKYFIFLIVISFNNAKNLKNYNL